VKWYFLMYNRCNHPDMDDCRHESFTIVAATANKTELLENPGYAQTPDRGFFGKSERLNWNILEEKNRTG
jgi:hypothetical protein